MGVNKYQVIRYVIYEGLAAARRKNEKPKTTCVVRKKVYSIADWCTQSITVQPMYVNELQEDVLPTADEETVPPATLDIQTEQTLLRTPANVSGK